LQLIRVADIIASGIQQEQNSESTDVDEPFSPSTKETFDVDSTSPQTFSAMSDSAQSDRQHGALSAETAAVDNTAEVDLVDSLSASLLLQSFDVTTSEEACDKVHKATAMELLVVEADATQVIAGLEESQDVEGGPLVDDKSKQKDYLKSDKESYQYVVSEETLDVIASCDECQMFVRPEDSTHLQSATKQEADAGYSVDSGKITVVSTKQALSVGVDTFDSDVTCRPFSDMINTDVDADIVPEDESTDSRSKQTTRDVDSSQQEENFRKTVEEEGEKEEKVHYVAEKDLSEEEKHCTYVTQKFEEHVADVTDAQSNRELLNDEHRKYTEDVPQISVSLCSSVHAEDDYDFPKVENTSIPASELEEDISYKHKVEEVESSDASESDAEVLKTIHQKSEQLIEYQSEEDACGLIPDHQTESLLFSEPSDVETERDNIMTDTESKSEPETEATEPATPEVERNLSHYHIPKEKETQEVAVAVVHEKVIEGLTEAEQLHDTKLLCSSTESMVSSTTSDWTVIDTREESESVESFSATVSVGKDATDTHQRADELSTSTFLHVAERELTVSKESPHDVLELKDEAAIGALDESAEDEVDEADAVEDYLTATVTPTVDLMVMSTVLESILEEEERTSSSQKTTSSSEKLEHDVSDSSKLLGSSPDMQHVADSPMFPPVGKFASGKSSDRDDVSVSSSLAEFERLERELQEKGSSDSFSGDKGSSESASAVAPAESPQRQSSTSLSSSLAEFERIERDILGQSGSLELITVDRKSHHTDSSSFTELERIEEMDKNGTAAEGQFRSSSASLAEFEYIEHQLRLNEELESEALKVATMLEKSRTSSAEKSPEAGSSQSDVRLSKEQIPESFESLSAEEMVQPAVSAEAQYPHYQDIVHIIREASRNVHTFQFGGHEISHTSTVSQVDGSSRLRQEETTSESFLAEISSAKTTLLEDVSTTFDDNMSWTEQHSSELGLEKSRLTTMEGDHGITDNKEESNAFVSSDVVGKSEIQQKHDSDLMTLSTDSLIVVQSEDLMQLSTDSLQPDLAMTASTDSLEIPETTDVHHSSTSTLSSVTTLVAAEGGDEEARHLMARSVDSLESDSREPSGEWVTVYEAEAGQQQYDDKTTEEDAMAMAESRDSLEAEFGTEYGQRLVGDDAGVVSGSASYESFEADSLQDEVDEEPTLVSSQSQDSLLVAGAAATSMDISFGSSGAWSQSNVSSCTTLGSSSDGEALTCSADLSTTSGGDGSADRRLSEPLSSIPLTAWSYTSVDNTGTMLDSEGNILIAAVSDEPRTPRPEDIDVGLDNRQFTVTDKQSISHTVEQPDEPTGHHPCHAGDSDDSEASAAVSVPPGSVLFTIAMVISRLISLYLIL